MISDAVPWEKELKESGYCHYVLGGRPFITNLITGSHGNKMLTLSRSMISFMAVKFWGYSIWWFENSSFYQLLEKLMWSILSPPARPVEYKKENFEFAILILITSFKQGLHGATLPGPFYCRNNFSYMTCSTDISPFFDNLPILDNECWTFSDIALQKKKIKNQKHQKKRIPFRMNQN